MAEIDESQPLPSEPQVRKHPRSHRFVPQEENSNTRKEINQRQSPPYRGFRGEQERRRGGGDLVRKGSRSPRRPIHEAKRKRGPETSDNIFDNSKDVFDQDSQSKKPKKQPAKQLIQPPNQHNRTSLNSRVRSLSKQLHRATNMPADIRQNKERELTSLLVERTRDAANKQRKKNLEKYHLVRFVERQKCERHLKKFLKATHAAPETKKTCATKPKGTIKMPKNENIESDSDVDMDSEGGVSFSNEADLILAKQIHEAKVNLNYTIYAPLGEKYISLFPLDVPRKIAGMSKADQARLTEEQREEVLANQNWTSVHNSSGEKPPIWYKVEECMAQGTLEQLREGKLTAAAVDIARVGGKSDAATRERPVLEWMKDGGEIAAEDLDSDSQSENDGGFFER